MPKPLPPRATLNGQDIAEQLRSVQAQEAKTVQEEINAVLARYGNRYALIGVPHFEMAGDGVWVISVSVGVGLKQ